MSTPSFAKRLVTMLRNYRDKVQFRKRKSIRKLLLEGLERREVFAAFVPGDLVVYRVGDGTETLANTGNTVFLDEYDTSGALLQSIQMPKTGAAGSKLVASGTATSEGLMNLSGDGSSLVLTGYDSTIPAASSLTASATTNVLRSVGRVAADGVTVVDTTTTSFSGNNIRSAVRDGNNVWMAGGNSGVVFTPVGGSGLGTVVNTGTTNIRDLNVQGGQLYYSTGSGTPGIYAVGAGLPTTTGNAATSLVTIASGSPYQFFFADLSSTESGLDTLYVADDRAVASGGGLLKFTKTGGTWAASGSIATATVNGNRGLTGVVNGSSVTLFGTNNTTIYSVTDTSGYGQSITGTPAVIATVASTTKQAFRGLALVPNDGVHSVVTSNGSTLYTVGNTEVVVDPAVTFADLSNFKGGSLQVAGHSATDTLAIKDSGTGAGQIGFDSLTGNVTFAGSQIGVLAASPNDGKNGNPLNVDFNANTAANPAVLVEAVQALARSITFKTSGTAVAGDRLIGFKVFEKGQSIATSVEKKVVVQQGVQPTLSVTTDSGSVALPEGQSGLTSFTFTVTRAVDTSGTSTVDWAVSGAGASPATADDFENNAFASGSLSFAPSEVSKTVTVKVKGDTVVESSEAFKVTLSNATNAIIATASDNALIVNDDASLAIQSAGVSLQEQNSGTTNFVFTVTRSGDTTVAHSVNYIVAGSGANPADANDFVGNVLPSGTLAFAAGETSKTITIPVQGDTIIESDETFTVTISSPTVGSILGATTASTGTIVDDDSVANLSISADQVSLNEGNVATTPFSFTVTRSVLLTTSVSVDWAVSGSGASAANATDFGGTFPTGSLSFAPGETTKTVTINVSGDTVIEPDEGFTVTLSNIVGGAILGATASSTILNDDIRITLAGGQTAKAEGNSGDTPFTFTLTRTGLVTGASSVDWAVTGTGTFQADASDFISAAGLPSGTVNFAANETSKTITVSVAGDTTIEPDEGFTVTISNPSANVVLGTTAATSTITNDDLQALVAGDVIITGVNTSGTDTVAFVPLVALAGNSTIVFTDNAYTGTALATNEGNVFYVAPSGGLPAGTKVVFEVSGGVATFLTPGTGTAVVSSGFALNASGENLLAYQGTAASPNFLFGLTTNNAYLTTGATSSANTYLPSSLIVGTSAIAPLATTGTVANVEYDHSKGTTGSKSALQQLVADVSKWTNSATSLTLNTNNFVVANGIIVTTPVAVDSGVSVSFSAPINAGLVNLYDQGGSLGPADVTLVGDNVGPISGSVVFNATNTAMSFIATGPLTRGDGIYGILPADTYTLTLRGAANGFIGADGSSLLDASGSTAGNFVSRFTVAPPAGNAITVSIPDFARGFDQDVNVPNTSTGLPVILSNANGVRQVSFKVTYDPTLLSITGFTSDVAGTTNVDLTVPGVASITVTGGSSFASADGEFVLGRFAATVPTTAGIGAKSILQIGGIGPALTPTILRGLSVVPALVDNSLQVVAFPGDMDGDQDYTSVDSILIQRIGLGVNNGAAAYQNADPFVFADVNNDFSLDVADPLSVTRKGIGLNVPTIPDLPATAGSGSTAPGPDPRLFIPTTLTVNPGDTVIVPVNVEVTEVGGITIAGLDLAISFDPSYFSIASTGAVTVGSLLTNAANLPAGGLAFTAAYSFNNTTGGIRIQESSPTGTLNLPQTTIGTLVNIALTAKATAPVGGTVINVRQNSAGTSVGSGTTTTRIRNNDLAALTLIPAPTNGTTDSNVDGLVTINGTSLANPTISVTAPNAVYNSLAYAGAGFSITGANAPIPPVSFTYYVGENTSGENLGTTAPKNVGTYTVVASSPANAANNAATSAPVTFQITKFGLTASGTAANKVYDATTNAAVTVSLTGIFAGDTVTGSATGTFDTKNVGNGKTVTIGAVSLAGASAGNYSVGSAGSTTASISKFALTASGTAANKVYDATTNASVTVLLGGVFAGDTVTGTATGAFDTKNVGTGKTVTIGAVSLAGVDSGNYSVGSAGTTTASISKFGLTASGTAADKVYDATTNASVTVSLGGVFTGDTVTSTAPGTFDSKNVGTGKTVTIGAVSLAGTDAGNYSVGSAGTTTASISKFGLTASGTAANKVYDATTNASITVSLGGVFAGDTVTATAPGTFDSKNVGTGKAVTIGAVSLAGTDAGNYSVGSAGSSTANITKFGLTASGTAANKVYDANTTASVTVSLGGVFTGDTVTGSASGTFDSKNVGTGKTVTISAVSLAGTDAGNYSVGSAGTTTASITKFGLTASGTAANKVYDATTNASVTVSLGGVFAGDTVTGSAPGTFDSKNVGTGKVVTIGAVSLAGTDAGNYSVGSAGSSTASITKFGLTASGTAANKVYDATTTAAVTVSLGGIFTGDTVTGTAPGTFGTKNVGTGKTVTVGAVTLAGADAGNYSVGSAGTTTASITKFGLTASGTAASKVYDATTNASVTVSLGGVFAGETVTGSAPGTFDTKNVGVGKTVTIGAVSLAGADAGNYSVGSAGTTTASISKFGLTASGTAANKVYDATTTAAVTVSLGGVFTGDTVTGTAPGAFDTKNVGTGKTVTIGAVALAGTDSGNYSVGSAGTTTASISKFGLTASGTAANKPFDGTVAASVNVVLSGVFTGDTVTGSAPGTFNNKNVGAGKTVTIGTVTLAGADLGNYSVGSAGTTTASITKVDVATSFNSGFTGSLAGLGGAQRSQLVNVALSFASPVLLTLGDINLMNLDKGVAGTAVDASQMVLTATGPNTYVLSFAFNNALGNGLIVKRGANGGGDSLADGNYQLSVAADEFSLGQNRNRTDNFFRLFGDKNGDGLVTGLELMEMRALSIQGGYNAAYDFDGNGILDVLDYNEINRNKANRRR